MRIIGTVEDGSGRCSTLSRQTPDHAWAPLGYTPHPGSLNLAVDPDAHAHVQTLPGVTVAGETYWPVTIGGEPAHAKTSRDPRTLEVVSPRPLREHLRLANGDRVQVTTTDVWHPRVSAVVMAHPVRERAVKELVEALDRPVPVVWDAQPVPSADPAQRWETGRRAWEAHDPTADWHVALQDDILVSRNLLDGLEAALDQLGRDGLVSAYTGTGRPDQRNVLRALAHADTHGHAWISTRSLNWGPAICAPTRTIEGMLAWCSRPARARTNYDLRLGLYYRDVLRWRTWYTVPSLVQTGRLPSLIGHDRGPKREAHRFHPGSALGVDWGAVPGGGLTARLG